MNKGTNNSKSIETHNRESLKELFSQLGDLFKSVLKYRFATRAVSLMIIFALLMPFILLSSSNSVSAQINPSTGSTAPISAPPIAYKFGSANPSVFSPAAVISTSVASVGNYVSAPTLPKGFEIAQTSSPLYKDVSTVGSSITSSIGSVLGFVVNSTSSTESTSNEMADGAFPAGAVPFDFDNDNYADVSRWNPSSGEWNVKDNQGNLTTESLGTSSSVIVPGDFDGDGKTDKAVWTNGTWTIRKSSGGTDVTHGFGTTGDIPVTGDYDNDGYSDYAVFRPSTNTWWMQSIQTGAITSTAFGASGDIPVQGDYDGDGQTDKAVFRPSTGYWHIIGSTAGYYAFPWGLSGDTPIPADFDGDGKTDYGIFRPSTGTWYIYYANNAPYTATVWGNYGDQPVAADYDGDGKADLSVWRPKTGVWLIKESNGGAYNYETLGMTGDVPVPAAYIQKVGGSVPDYDFAKLRLEPINSTGGTDLYSRNFSWATELVTLPGGSGLHAGFGISYNSLLWLKDPSNDTMTFDPDYSNITPGFNFGYSRIEPVYWDKNNGRFSYILVSPSGARVEFHQIGATNTYETVDSSYVQLKTNGASNPNDPVDNITITITGTDGTMMEYEYKAGAFRTKQIKDRNGNFITINHDDNGLLKTVTDTLGRVITVNYDAELYPTTITQDWKTNNGSGSTTTHTYATFSYTNKLINPSFKSTYTVYGPTNNTSIKVLDKITGASGAFTQFEYNDYGQVWKINNHAIDGHKLNHTSVNLSNPAVDQDDVPRFTETRSFVENFNSGNEIIINNEFLENQSIPSPGSGTGTRLRVWMTNHPTSNESRTFVGNSGWQEALPIITEDYANDGTGLTRKRWSWTNWTQDDTSLTYIKNPRATESKIGDDENNYVRGTTTDYRLLPNTTIAEYGLVDNVKVYDADQTTVLRKVETDYNLNSAYISKRIIGLPSETRSYGLENSSLNLVSKATYAYDEGDFSDSSMEQNITPIQQDDTNYGASFIIGRGNLTSTTRWNVDYPTTASEAVTSSVKYNTAGSPVAGTSPDPNNSNGRVIKTSYADDFSDTPSDKNTYAYPTTVTDPNNKSSTVKYRFDLGANVWAKSPAPAGQTNGIETKRTYDSLGRLEKQALWKPINGPYQEYSYSRYDYSDTSQTHSKVYSTVIDTNTNGKGDSADEVLSESWTDGAGRTLKSRSEHPGSSGGYAGGFVEYNILGQVTRSTTPTEINSSWQATGDDSEFLWKEQEYNWKGSITKQINTDLSDKLISFEGCGCAGGQVTTIESELVPRDDQPTVNTRRKQKIYTDILGRTTKTEIYNWDGSSVYTTTTQTFNGRDQVTKTRQFAGDEQSTTFQDVIRTYDGHGRMKTRQYPIEEATKNTTWNYNIDDSVDEVVDPRGTITDFVYDNRGLVTNINYHVPSGSSIPDSPDVTMTYDDLGNRTSMTDGLGTQTYTYNELSQITSETRAFNDSLTNAPLSNNTYKLEYEYNLSGGLKSVKDPFSDEVTYTHDKIGRLTAVNGTAFGDNTSGNYLDGIKYRAFGSIKQMNYKTNDNALVKMEYDNALRVDLYEVDSTVAPTGDLKKATYTYNKDSRTKTMDDAVDAKFDRTFKYDQVGRLKENNFGSGTDIPYEQTIEYDAFSQITNRDTTHWTQNNEYDATYTQGRESTVGITGTTYDDAGNMTHSGSRGDGTYQTYTFDSANRRKVFYSHQKVTSGRFQYGTYTVNRTNEYDGDGHPLKTTEVTMNIPEWQNEATLVKYQLWSTVLGGYITALKDDGAKETTKVYAGGAVIAEQTTRYGNEVYWIHADPVTGSSTKTTKTGAEYTRKEYEPFGQEVAVIEPEEEFPAPEGNADNLVDANDPHWQCQMADAIGTDFNIRPVHCQRSAQLEGVSNADMYAEILGHQEAQRKRRTKAKKLPVNPSPTDKPQAEASGRDAGGDSSGNGGGGGSAVPESSTPNSGGEDGCKYGTDGSKNNCIVYASMIDMEDTGVAASVSSNDDFVYINLPEDIEGKIKKRLEQNDGMCNKFISKLISKVEKMASKQPYVTFKADAIDGLSLLNKIKSQGGFKLVKNLKIDGTPVGGTVKGSIRGNDASVLIGAKGAYESSIKNAPNAIKDRQKSYITGAIHEMIHLAARRNFGDQNLARALKEMGEITENIPKKETSDLNEILRYSNIWNFAFKKHCGEDIKPNEP